METAAAVMTFLDAVNNAVQAGGAPPWTRQKSIRSAFLEEETM